MEIRYGLTDQNCKNLDGIIYEIGKTSRNKEEGFKLYKSPLLASFFAFVYYNFESSKIFKVMCEDGVTGNGLIDNCKIIIPVEEIKVPRFTIRQQIAFIILSSLKVDNNSDWIKLANKWLLDNNYKKYDNLNWIEKVKKWLLEKHHKEYIHITYDKSWNIMFDNIHAIFKSKIDKGINFSILAEQAVNNY